MNAVLALAVEISHFFIWFGGTLSANTGGGRAATALAG